MINIAEVEKIFKELLDDDKCVVKSIETLYEYPESGRDFMKLVISIHGLLKEDISIIHTKFVFKVDNKKRNLDSNSFIYLYDLNCIYKKVDFTDYEDLKSSIKKTIDSYDFGEDIQLLSDFIEAPAMFLNFYMRKNKITDYSIFDVEYEPKFKTTPCSKATFDFKININNNYTIYLSIKKYDKYKSNTHYKFFFKFLDVSHIAETNELKNIHLFIGSNIAKILDSKLKNK
jgi:hypothetical protein